MSSRLAIFSIDSNDGCEELVHHFETVVGAQPNCSANHLLVFFFSAKITFKRFKSLASSMLILYYYGAKIINYPQKRFCFKEKDTNYCAFNELFSFLDYFYNLLEFTRRELVDLGIVVKLFADINHI